MESHLPEFPHPYVICSLLTLVPRLYIMLSAGNNDPESLRWNHYQYPLKKVSKYSNAMLKALFGCKQISFIWLENESLWISSFLYILAIKMSYDSFPPLWRRERREENVYYVASWFSCNRNFHLTYITKHILIKKDSELLLVLNPSSKLLWHYSELRASPSIQMFMRPTLLQAQWRADQEG